MSLGFGRHTLAIPGPSVMPDRVLQAMHRPAPNIYSGEIVDIAASLFPDLKEIAQTQGHCAMYIGNGHAAWEAALANTLSRGDEVLVLATGFFGEAWGWMADRVGINTQVLDFGKRADLDLAQIKAALRADSGHKIKAITCVQVDTTTSVKNDIAALRKTIDAVGHPALLMVDCIACLGCDRFEMDAWGVDVMVAGCQKGLMVPPGLAFVFFNDKADHAQETADLVSTYWDWRPRANPEQFYQISCGTAPTHHIYGLREALNMIHEEGLDNVWTRHEVLARAVWSAFDHWGQDGPVELNIADPSKRSVAVTSVRLEAPFGDDLQAWVKQEAGLTLGIGLGMAPRGSTQAGGFFRVGHMGHLSAHMLLGTLATIEAGLIALDVPHRPGGVTPAAQVIADHTRRATS